MTVAERQEAAAKAHAAGYNCAQAVAYALRDTVADRMDADALFRATEGFGLGMGGMEGTCGALSGAVLIAGLLKSGGPEGQPTKGQTYRLTKALLQRFQEKNRSVRCKDLKGAETGAVLRSCPGCIADAVEIACEVLELPD